MRLWYLPYLLISIVSFSARCNGRDIQALLQQMTLEQKAGQMAKIDIGNVVGHTGSENVDVVGRNWLLQEELIQTVDRLFL